MSIVIEGRGISVHPADDYEGPELVEYRKTATVIAVPAALDGVVRTPEGDMAFVAGDYIVTDNPVTHAWPVRREVFERTHVKVTS